MTNQPSVINNNETQPAPGTIETLKKYWGYDSFRPLQEKAIHQVLNYQDSIVVLPTGGGKSLCFQVPALVMPGMAIVISPLISLMKDQVDALLECGVKAARLDSTLHPVEQDMIYDQIRNHELKLLYLSPERLFIPGFVDFLKKHNISFIAIDEGHCISMWGHDFRPEYRQLGRLKELFPNLAMHAYTATATQQVRNDIAKQLKMPKPEILVGSFDRPNLIYKAERRDDVVRQVSRVLDRHKNRSGIVYCIRRIDVDEMNADLKRLGYKSLSYHAGMPPEERKKNQDAFFKEEVDTIVATVAFGMGIDKSNVRYVIHTGMPKSLEHYQQESGRAGRDGLNAECWLFYSGEDFKIWQYLMKDLDSEAQKIASKKLNDMFNYCSGIVCRHKALVNYFGQKFDKENCGACDVCIGDMDFVEDALVIAQKILSCIKRIDERFGADYTALVLTGSQDKRILENKHDQVTTYGLLSEHPKHIVRDWIEQLIAQGYAEKYGEYNTIRVTDKGWLALKAKETPRLLQPSKTKGQKAAQVQRDLWDNVDEGLFEELRQLRREIAKEKDVPAFVIFNDVTLRNLAILRPTKKKSFIKVPGIGEKKAEEYFSQFGSCITTYCYDNNLETDQHHSNLPDSTPFRRQKIANNKSEAKDKAFQLFKEGVPLYQVSKEICRKESTTRDYLVDYVFKNKLTDVTQWVDQETQTKVINAAKQYDDGRLKTIYDHLNGEIAYYKIKISLACLHNQSNASST